MTVLASCLFIEKAHKPGYRRVDTSSTTNGLKTRQGDDRNAHHRSAACSVASLEYHFGITTDLAEKLYDGKINQF
jgi:hypothetical protein